jgi:tryptophan synthase alpha chain
MSRIGSTLNRERGDKALALFLTAGYPRADSLRTLVPYLLDGGMDILEIGMPFSDPLADGPVIQESSTIALRNGVRLATILDDVAALRRSSEVPIVLMGYANPILRYGAARFFRDAASAGADGVILPELPLEEVDRFGGAMSEVGLDNILLVTPSSPVDRMESIDAASAGFLYCVSTTGVTGSRARVASEEYIRKVKVHARKNPVLVGFGIATVEDAGRLGPLADGIVVGSALLREVARVGSAGSLTGWTRSMKDALVGK